MQYIVPAFAAVIVAIIEAIAAKERKETRKTNEIMEIRAKQRSEESLLSMKLLDATLQLSIVSANALTNGHNNGNVEKARKAAEEASREYEEFLRKLAAKEMNI